MSETKTITAKDLASYIGCMCMFLNEKEELAKGLITDVNTKRNKVFVSHHPEEFEPEKVFPILKLLENITIEDTIHISCEIMGYDREDDETHKKWNENDKQSMIEFGYFQFDTKDSIYTPAITMYLISRGYNLHLLPHGSYVEFDGREIDLSPILKHVEK